MCPMNPRLLRPLASGVHPEAAAWRTAVVANGGTVSASTMNAVSKFCRAIDAAGIRDRFYRLNLFCGTSDASLNAVRTPLFRGQSRTGTQYGGTLDTNVNFVQGDYAETGASGGLVGNGTTKYFNTGLAPNALPSVATGHMAYWTEGGTVTSTKIVIGTADATDRYRMDIRTSATGGNLSVWGKTTGAGNVVSGNTSQDSGAGLFAVTRTSSTALTIYKNGSTLGESPTATGSVTPAAHGNAWFVFAYNNAGTASDFYQYRLRSYSIGDGMTAAQMLSYYTALLAFNTAMGRS